MSYTAYDDSHIIDTLPPLQAAAMIVDAEYIRQTTKATIWRFLADALTVACFAAWPVAILHFTLA